MIISKEQSMEIKEDIYRIFNSQERLILRFNFDLNSGLKTIFELPQIDFEDVDITKGTISIRRKNNIIQYLKLNNKCLDELAKIVKSDSQGPLFIGSNGQRITVPEIYTLNCLFCNLFSKYVNNLLNYNQSSLIDSSIA